MKTKKQIRSPKRPARPRTSSDPVAKGAWDLFRYLVDHIGDEVLVVDSQSRIALANKAAIKGIGYSRKNIIGRNLTDFLKDKISVKQWQRTYFNEVKRKRKPISYIINRVVKGNKVRTIDITVSYMPYETREYVLIVGRDITEQLSFHTKLKESEDRYRLLSEQAADGILMIDPNGATLYANKAAAKMFKTTTARMIGEHFETHVGKSSLSKLWKYFRKVKTGSPIIHAELEIKDKKGKLIPVEFTASPIFRGGKVFQIHVIFRDVSQKKNMAELIRESEKMEALQHFIAGTTHEIQQPLKGLLDHSQGLIDRYKDRHFEYIGFKEFKDIMKTLQTMNDQVKYCFDTTDRLNTLNRKKVKLGDASSNANQIIRQTVSMLKHSLEVSEIKLRLRLDAHLPQVAISSLELGQALNNILTNAIQSLPGIGGNIRVKTAYQKSADRIRIEIHDDGVGIPDEVLKRVFDPFFTTKPRGLEKSSGLGLYIVYTIIKAHQGEISVKSNYRKGTFVTITLPAVKHKKK